MQEDLPSLFTRLLLHPILLNLQWVEVARVQPWMVWLQGKAMEEKKVPSLCFGKLSITFP